jgi:hypothetical protein
MSVSFISKIQELEQQCNLIQDQSSTLENTLRGRKVDVQDAQCFHANIMQVYKDTTQNITSLIKTIDGSKTVENQDQLLPQIQQVTGMEDKLKSALNRLNDTLLSSYPTAKIEYGRACIGPQKAPYIENAGPKLQRVLSNSVCIREIRGDGNCFVSSFAVRFLENLVDKKLVGNFIIFVTADGIQEPTLKQEIITILVDLDEYPSQKDKILENNEKILPLIHYFRLLAAQEMKNNRNSYEATFRADVEQALGGIQTRESYEALIKEYVIKMGVDFCHPSITALCKSLSFSVNIIDSMLANDGFNVLEDQMPQATFCRNGAHYFVLYTKEEMINLPLPQPTNPIVQQAIPTINIPQSPSNPTEIVIKYQAPFGHTLFILGSGCGLSWKENEAIPLIEGKDGTYIYHSATPLTEGLEYKFKLDNQIWENRNGNRKITKGKCDDTTPKFTPPPSTEIFQDMAIEPQRNPMQIVIKYNAGLGNSLFIRGEGGAGLNWNKGIKLQNTNEDTWVFKTNADFSKIKYKILINDDIAKWELGDNHETEGRKDAVVIPKFPN